MRRIPPEKDPSRSSHAESPSYSPVIVGDDVVVDDAVLDDRGSRPAAVRVAWSSSWMRVRSVSASAGTCA